QRRRLLQRNYTWLLIFFFFCPLAHSVVCPSGLHPLQARRHTRGHTGGGGVGHP
ncbi:unnamed protein product, partial [Pylaiella littoralis]